MAQILSIDKEEVRKMGGAGAEKQQQIERSKLPKKEKQELLKQLAQARKTHRILTLGISTDLTTILTRLQNNFIDDKVIQGYSHQTDNDAPGDPDGTGDTDNKDISHLLNEILSYLEAYTTGGDPVHADRPMDDSGTYFSYIVFFVSAITAQLVRLFNQPAIPHTPPDVIQYEQNQDTQLLVNNTDWIFEKLNRIFSPSGQWAPAPVFDPKAYQPCETLLTAYVHFIATNFF